jgi:hypothetical protein
MFRYAYRYPDGAAGTALLFVLVCCARAALGVASMLA